MTEKPTGLLPDRKKKPIKISWKIKI